MSNEFASKYTDKKIGASQWIAEFVCERLAFKQKKQLVYRFWNTQEWKAVFLNQMRAAQSLLKLYTVQAIMNVLSQNKNVYSLRAPWLDAQFQVEQLKLDALLTNYNPEKQISLPNIPETTETRATFSTTKNKLKGL